MSCTFEKIPELFPNIFYLILFENIHTCVKVRTLEFVFSRKTVFVSA